MTISKKFNLSMLIMGNCVDRQTYFGFGITYRKGQTSSGAGACIGLFLSIDQTDHNKYSTSVFNDSVPPDGSTGFGPQVWVLHAVHSGDSNRSLWDQDHERGRIRFDFHVLKPTVCIDLTCILTVQAQVCACDQTLKTKSDLLYCFNGALTVKWT